MTLQRKLKEATIPLHRQIDHNFFAKNILQTKGTLDMYIQWLIRFYGFYAPIENFIQESNFSFLETIHINKRFKVPLLSQDLELLGQTDLEHITQCSDLPKLNDDASLLGYLYVAEGSTLGGQFIVGKLKQYYGFDGNKGCQFFNSYGDQTADMWKKFCLFLNEYPCDENKERIAIQTACDTFEKLNKWLNS